MGSLPTSCPFSRPSPLLVPADTSRFPGSKGYFRHPHPCQAGTPEPAMDVDLGVHGQLLAPFHSKTLDLVARVQNQAEKHKAALMFTAFHASLGQVYQFLAHLQCLAQQSIAVVLHRASLLSVRPGPGRKAPEVRISRRPAGPHPLCSASPRGSWNGTWNELKFCNGRSKLENAGALELSF